MASGWGAGLTALSQGIGSMQEVIAKRKAEELLQRERDRVQQERLAESARQEQELKLRQREIALREQQGTQQESTAVAGRAQQTPLNTPFDPQTVADLQRTGNQGMIRTVGAGQTALPSRQYQRTPDLESAFRETQDPGAVEGMYRQPTTAERDLENKQQEARQVSTEKRISDEAFRGQQGELDRQNRLEIARLREEDKKGQEQQNGRPYYQFMPIYDDLGRPVGVQAGNARTGTIAPVQGAGLNQRPPGTLGAQAIGNETALDQLDRLEALAAKQGEKMGPLMGRLNSVSQSVPGTTVDPDFAALKAASDAFTNSVIKAITGAQMSEPEAKRIKSQIPLYTDKPEVFAAKAKQTRQNLQDLEHRITTPRSKEEPQERGGIPVPAVGGLYNGEKVLSVTRTK